MAREKGIDAVLNNLKDIQKLNGVVRKVSVAIQSNGKKDRENPASYGWHLDQSKRYAFSDPALENFGSEVMKDARVIQYFKDMIAMNKKRRSSQSMDEAAILMAKVAVDKVTEYIMFEKPQVAQPWKRSGERNLVETVELLESIYGRVTREKKEVWRGF